MVMNLREFLVTVTGYFYRRRHRPTVAPDVPLREGSDPEEEGVASCLELGRRDSTSAVDRQAFLKAVARGMLLVRRRRMVQGEEGEHRGDPPRSRA